jgi:S-DNA-T family DNA segregation ATPase FtsK/SpoIIIE
MLYLAPGTGVPVRVHGAFVADQEVHTVVEDWRGRGTPEYIEGLLDEHKNIPGLPNEDGEEGESDDPESDPLYDEAVKVVVETRRASISGVQRRLKIGYNRAARLLEAMESAGLVSPMESNGTREVLVPGTVA